MTADETIRLIAAISGLLGVLVWPALVLVLAVRFRAPLGDFLGHLSEFSVKAGGVEASLRRQRAGATAALGAAIASKDPTDRRDPQEAADVVAAAVPDARSQRRLSGQSVLWVDDRPDNNRYERQALESLGVRVRLSLSTEDALALLAYEKFDLIISDMSRPEDRAAGLTLLDELRNRGDRTPVVFYTGTSSDDQRAEARRRGALGQTNSPSELIRMVTAGLADRPPSGY